MKVLTVVGTRPNFIKTAPVLAEMNRRTGEFESTLIHTGQHYDHAMSQLLLDELGVGEPDVMLGVGSGTHAVQTARVLERLEHVLLEHRPDLVLVPGDVNSTLAAALCASKLQIPVAHLEAGLRSFDRTMPEETNRLLTDQLADLLFTHSPEARENLEREGVNPAAIHEVGNTMIDTLRAMQPRLAIDAVLDRHRLEPGKYLLVTLHRPALVDGPLLDDAVSALKEISEADVVVFPCHPRTRAEITDRGLASGGDGQAASSGDRNGLRLIGPVGYLEFLALTSAARAVITDSGGIQEETTVLEVPCFTLRDNTERPITISLGTNVLLGLEPSRIRDVPRLLAQGLGRATRVPDGWDGQASSRVVDVLSTWRSLDRP